MLTHESFLWRFIHRQTLINYKVNELELTRRLKETENELRNVVKDDQSIISMEDDKDIQALISQYKNYQVGTYLEDTLV